MHIFLTRLRTTALLSTTAALAMLAACGGGGGGSGTGTAPPLLNNSNGTLSVALTDAPACGFDAVNITVNKVRVHQSNTAADTDGGWAEIVVNPARKINLLSLSNGVLEPLGQTTLPAGRYTQLRLVLDANGGTGMANTVIPSGSTTEKPLDTPSAVQSGIKLNGEIDVVAGQRADVVLDFDACKSVVTRGNGKYALTPVIKIVPTAVNGISGFVSTGLLGSQVTVSAQQNGAIIASTSPGAGGEFFLARLVPGTYDVVITADGRAASVIAAVPVASSTSTTALSSAAAPIGMASSASASISGSATLAPVSTTAAAYVAARQSFAGGPTVTIKYQGADALSGAYALTSLPLAAPQYATYSASLPLQFSTAANVQPGPGRYRLEASASGYVAKSVGLVDISAGSQTNVNFSLVP